MNIDVAFNGTYAFHPPNITAPVGTLVTFYFPNSPITHSVTQSSFANPCTYLAANATTNSSAGFDSNLQSAATFTLNITDTSPIWYYCKQFMHCGMGMVGSINAVGDTYTTYLNTALGIGSNEMLTPNNGPPVVAGVHATATGPPVSDISGTSASPSPTSSSSGAIKVTTSIGFALFAAVVMTIAMA
jgi:plastocyanin